MLGPDDDGGVVIGVGSPLMGDDGLGLVALEALREQWEFTPYVELLDGGTWGMNLLPFIESARRVLIIDAVHAGREAGGFVRLEKADIPRFFAMKLSPHQIDLKEVLALAELRGNLPEQTVVLGLEPDVVEMSAILSPTVAERIPGLVDEIVGQLRTWGYEAQRRQ
ncbi:MAG: HyaD/HybD family hydrogenase maturation endopeptidase [Gemmatimonadales bacterium]|jgi:hydrogenase maturation protease